MKEHEHTAKTNLKRSRRKTRWPRRMPFSRRKVILKDTTCIVRRWPTDTRERIFAIMFRRTIVSDVVQGLIIGGVLGFITFWILAHAYVVNVNGWTTMYGCSEPGNGILLHAACGVVYMGPINVPEEAMYWTTGKDGAGQQLSGAHDYLMHFAAGQLPPNNAFWSLTMGDAKNRFVANPINRYSVSDRSGLVPNADGSVDIYIQNTAPTGYDSNWLPAARQAISASGCRTCPGKSFLTASTSRRRSSK